MKRILILCALVMTCTSGPLAAAEFDYGAFHLGKLHYGMPAAQAVGLPGCVFTKNKLATSEVDGAWHQSWDAAGCGVTLGFVAKEKKAALTLDQIEIQAPSQIKTDREVGVGSSEADVRTHYAKDINAEESRPQETIVLGSIYGGVIFDLDKGRVVRIFVGAAAE
ncbi:MAG: hypothetical protein RL497_601 [Pseudomonadota bacterium]|jgi:opacity protein-like surface antigen